MLGPLCLPFFLSATSWSSQGPLLSTEAVLFGFSSHQSWAKWAFFSKLTLPQVFSYSNTKWAMAGDIGILVEWIDVFFSFEEFCCLFGSLAEEV
jgi:hypothetical protein